MKRLPLSAALLTVTSIIFSISSTVMADPCLVVYPGNDCIYMYDPSEYYTVGLGHPLYDPEYDRGGEVLLEIGTNEIDHSIYQAPNLIGFMPSFDGMEGYFFSGSSFTLILDGFSNDQTIYENIKLVFGFVEKKGDCVPTVIVDGVRLTNLVYGVGDMVVSTPTERGNNYSDIMSFSVTWYGCYGLHVWAYADENYNDRKDGGECFTAFSHDITIDTEDTSWGAIKTIIR
ncbi:MAG TPA: hypothetical protein VMX58_04825 [Patescibacteria group bacterium]|nr:hypothetical protein [Patescibacteria group bacterium]